MSEEKVRQLQANRIPDETSKDVQQGDAQPETNSAQAMSEEDFVDRSPGWTEKDPGKRAASSSAESPTQTERKSNI